MKEMLTKGKGELNYLAALINNLSKRLVSTNQLHEINKLFLCLP